MKIYKAIILVLLFALLGTFWGYEIWEALKQHWHLFMRWCHDTKVSYYPWCIWLLGGVCIFPHKFFVKNMELTKIFTHELTHTITGVPLFRRIPSFPIIDVIIGFSIGLHIVCFTEQTRSYQTDINQYPLWFSYIYIVSVWLFSFSLIMMAYLPKMNIFLAFQTYALDAWHLIF